MLPTQISVYDVAFRLQNTEVFWLYYLCLSHMNNNSSDTKSSNGGNLMLNKYCECLLSIMHSKNLPTYFPQKERSSLARGNHFKPSSSFNLSLCTLQ